MGGAKEYERDFERLMGELEAKDSLRGERALRSVMDWIEKNRKAIGMKPKELYGILDRKGPEELLAEIKRRLGAAGKPATRTLGPVRN